MASIRITKFAGLLPTANPKALENDHAQLAHNCLLWDGWLWPMPKWIPAVFYPLAISGLYKDKSQSFGFNANYWLKNAVLANIEPFDEDKVIGIQVIGGAGVPYLGTYKYLNSWSADIRKLGVPAPKIYSYPASFSVTHQNKSKYPISRTYAVTYVSEGREGPPLVFQQLGTSGDLLYEGDLVTISAVFALSVYDNVTNVDSMRLYRSIPGFDTSEELGNPLETGFHLVKVVSLNRISSDSVWLWAVDDVGWPNVDSAKIPGDLLISEQWIPPLSDSQSLPIYFGLTEGGWFVNARHNGNLGGAVQFSERFMSHAWPMQNTVVIPNDITGMAIYYDSIFIGTQSVAYHVDVALGEQETLNLQVRPYRSEYACIPNTMVATNFGAMYASKDGLIALTADSDTVATKHLANPGDEILYVTIPRTLGKTHFGDTLKAGWWNGNYFGFVSNGGYGYAYVYNQPSPANNEFPLGQLVTIDTPHVDFVDSIATGYGFFAAWSSDQTVYKLPLPGFGYEAAPKATYTWKSKRFVMSGLTTFAGMKVINDNSGDLYVALIGYNTSTSGSTGTPDFMYTRYLNHSKPFRLPHNHKCMEWEIELIGTAVVQEIHVSTSYKDLVEDSNVGISASA